MNAGLGFGGVLLMEDILHRPVWGFPKIRGTALVIPIIRLTVYWGLYWVPLFSETTIYLMVWELCKPLKP